MISYKNIKYFTDYDEFYNYYGGPNRFKSSGIMKKQLSDNGFLVVFDFYLIRFIFNSLR